MARNKVTTLPEPESAPEFIDTSPYDLDGFLPQTSEAYTALSIVRVKNETTNFPLYVVRQTDIVEDQIVKVTDSDKTDKNSAIYQLRNISPRFVKGPSL